MVKEEANDTLRVGRQIVDQFIKGERHIIDILRSVPEPRPPIVEVMLHVREAMSGEYPMDQALREVRAVNVDDIPDPNLAILFLNLWVALISGDSTGRVIEHAALLVRRMKALVSECTPAEFRFVVLTAQSTLEQLRGNLKATEEAYERAIASLTEKSPHYRYSLWHRAMLLAEQGRGAEVEADLERMAGMCDEHFQPGWIAMARFFNCVETGQAEEAMRLLPQVEVDSALYDYLRGKVQAWQYVAELMLGRWKAPSSEDDAPKWALSTHSLFLRRPEEALRHARAYVAAKPSIHLRGTFHSLTLIRAELSCGNREAALRLLAQRREREAESYLDDFFLARAEVLGGNSETAAGHLVAVRKACERYGAQRRLEFEIDLACELSSGQLMRLMNAAGQVREVLPPVGAPLARAEPQGLARLLGRSAAVDHIRELVGQLAPLDVPVLVTGETGTGKELVARALHEESPRRGEPFLAVNCGAISESLLASELFGHEKGAFTGAEKAHQGLFEEAGGGTIMLDEIGEIPPQLQVALLRVLEADEVRPVGSAHTRKISCRIIAVTNADLAALAEEKRFRNDLLFRLQRLEVNVPPLRERPDDILPLADHFLSKERTSDARPVMSAGLKRALRSTKWPGNVRELRNTIERMRLLNSDKLAYEVEDLDSLGQEGTRKTETGERPAPPAAGDSEKELRSSRPGMPDDGVEQLFSRGETMLRRVDRLRALLEKHGKLTRAEAARILGVAPDTAGRYLKQLCREGFARKVEPTRSPRTHYFRLKESPPR